MIISKSDLATIQSMDDELLKSSFSREDYDLIKAGKKDLSKLTAKVVTDKNGVSRKVYVNNHEEVKEEKPKKKEELKGGKKHASYDDHVNHYGKDHDALMADMRKDGHSWKESDHKGVNTMRAKMALKAHYDGNKSTPTWEKDPKKAEAPKVETEKVTQAQKNKEAYHQKNDAKERAHRLEEKKKKSDRFPNVKTAKPNAEFYAEFDEDSGSYCVFDTEDGKAWASYMDEKQAKKRAEEMTKDHKNNQKKETPKTSETKEEREAKLRKENEEATKDWKTYSVRLDDGMHPSITKEITAPTKALAKRFALGDNLAGLRITKIEEKKSDKKEEPKKVKPKTLGKEEKLDVEVESIRNSIKELLNQKSMSYEDMDKIIDRANELQQEAGVTLGRYLSSYNSLKGPKGVEGAKRSVLGTISYDMMRLGQNAKTTADEKARKPTVRSMLENSKPTTPTKAEEAEAQKTATRKLKENKKADKEEKAVAPKVDKLAEKKQAYQKLLKTIENKSGVLQRALNNSNSGRGFYSSENPVNTLPADLLRSGGIDFEYRDDGQYFTARRGEEDDDQPNFTGHKKIKSIVDAVFADMKKDVDIIIEPQEKWYITISVIPKVAKELKGK